VAEQAVARMPAGVGRSDPLVASVVDGGTTFAACCRALVWSFCHVALADNIVADYIEAGTAVVAEVYRSAEAA